MILKFLNFYIDNFCVAGLFVSKSAAAKQCLLSPEDRTWLVNHTSHGPEQIDRLHREFYIDYPNGGIFRK